VGVLGLLFLPAHWQLLHSGTVTLITRWAAVRRRVCPLLCGPAMVTVSGLCELSLFLSVFPYPCSPAPFALPSPPFTSPANPSGSPVSCWSPSYGTTARSLSQDFPCPPISSVTHPPTGDRTVTWQDPLPLEPLELFWGWRCCGDNDREIPAMCPSSRTVCSFSLGVWGIIVSCLAS
jgi:hypothetical protein